MKFVIVECVNCNIKKEVVAGAIKDGEQPMCELCGMPMIPIGAIDKVDEDD